MRKSILHLILALVVVCSAFSSCAKNGGDPKEPSVSEAASTTLKGVHDVSISATDSYIVKDGKTDYKILLSKEPTEYEMEAALIINRFVSEAVKLLENIRFRIEKSTRILKAL